MKDALFQIFGGDPVDFENLCKFHELIADKYTELQLAHELEKL